MKRTRKSYAHLWFAILFIAVAAAVYVVLPEVIFLALIIGGCLLIDRHRRRHLVQPAPGVEMVTSVPDTAPYVSPFNPVETRVFRCVDCCARSGEPHAANCPQAATDTFERAAAVIGELVPAASPFGRSVAIDTTRLELLESEKPPIKFFDARVWVGGAYGDTLREAIDKWSAARARAGSAKGPAE